MLTIFSLFWLSFFAQAEELRLTGFQRFGQPTEWERGSELTDGAMRPGIFGVLSLARVGPISSIHPYDREDGKAVRRATIVDDLLYETLMLEDPFGMSEKMYPLVARAVRLPNDFHYVVFELNPAARFNDGAPILGSDINFSYQQLRASDPAIAARLNELIESVAVQPSEIRFNLRVRHQEARDAIMLLASMKVLKPNTTSAQVLGGVRVRFTGSGPYTITNLGTNRLELIKNVFYWGQRLDTRVGFFNFREVNLSVFHDEDAAAEALLEGRVNLLDEPRRWAVREITERLKQTSSPAIPRSEPRPLAGAPLKSYVFNLDRPALRDYRVRKALLLAYDFSLINQIYHGSDLRRPSSLLTDTSQAPTGLPSNATKILLASCPLPAFATEEFEKYGHAQFNALTDKRERLLMAMRLFQEGGLKLVNGKQMFTGADGVSRPVKLRLIAADPSEKQQLEFFKSEISRLGIDGEVISGLSDDEREAVYKSGDYDLASESERFLGKDFWPRADMARSIFHSRGESLGHLRLNCVDAIVERMAKIDPFGEEYRASAEALARIQQILYLNIFIGEPGRRIFFADQRVKIPATLSLERAHIYGFWSSAIK